MKPLNKICTKCGSPWDGIGFNWKPAERSHCNICERKAQAKHQDRVKGYQVLHSLEYYGWTVEVLADDSCIEYRITDEKGRTVEFSTNGYGNEAVAMRDGLQKMFDLDTKAHT